MRELVQHRRRGLLPRGPGLAEALRPHGGKAHRAARGVPAEARGGARDGRPGLLDHRAHRCARASTGLDEAIRRGRAFVDARRERRVRRGARVDRRDVAGPRGATRERAPRREHGRAREDAAPLRDRARGGRLSPRASCRWRRSSRRRTRSGRSSRRSRATARRALGDRDARVRRAERDRRPPTRDIVASAAGPRDAVRRHSFPRCCVQPRPTPRRPTPSAIATSASRTATGTRSPIAWPAGSPRAASGAATSWHSCCRSTPLYHLSPMAARRCLGAVTTGINVRYRRTEIGHVLRQSGREAPARRERLVRRRFPRDRRVAPAGAAGARDDRVAGARRHPGEHAGDRPAPRVARRRPIESAPDDPIAIVFTSGTTGAPKGAWYTHRNLLALAEIEEPPPRGRRPRRRSTWRRASRSRTSARWRGSRSDRRPGPVDHAGHVRHGRHAGDDRARAARRTCGCFPTQAIMLLDHPERPRRDLTSLKAMLLGGAPSSPALIRRVQETLGTRSCVRYSSTEVGIATSSLADDPIDVLVDDGRQAHGRRRAPHRRRGAASRCPPAQRSGTVVIRSPATMRGGYWRNPDATATTIDRRGLDPHGRLGLARRRRVILAPPRPRERDVHPRRLQRVSVGSGRPAGHATRRSPARRSWACQTTGSARSAGRSCGPRDRGRSADAGRAARVRRRGARELQAARRADAAPRAAGDAELPRSTSARCSVRAHPPDRVGSGVGDT